MTRGLGLLSLVVSLVVSAVLFSSQLSHGGSKSASPKENPLVQQANSVAAETVMLEAERELAAYQTEQGTFAGATLNGVSGVTLLHAEATAFCVQISSGAGVLYDAGPGGTLSSDRC